MDEHFFKSNTGKWNPKLMGDFEKFLTQATDDELFSINPMHFAAKFQSDPKETINLFLHGAHEGILNLNWNMICSCCGGFHRSLNSMSGLHSYFVCNICHHSTNVSVNEYIQVTFTPTANFREIRFSEKDNLTIDDFLNFQLFSKDSYYGDGLSVVEAHKQRIVFKGTLLPGEEIEQEIFCKEGFYDLLCPPIGSLLQGEVSDEAPSKITITITDLKVSHPETKIANGNVNFSIKNETKEKAFYFMMHFLPEMLSAPTPQVSFHPFLSAKALLSNQTFRDLFRYEIISSEEGISVQDITILFSDLKGSTELYETIGDMDAFALVRQHFDVLKKAIDKYNGSVVKTIGDAVMASFVNPVDALKSAILMSKEIQKFNDLRGKNYLHLKIGFHRGDAIVVSLNDKLDYFGQTVNLASRVQSIANSQEIYFTEEVKNADHMENLLKEYSVVEKEVSLKGIKEKKKVFGISLN